MHDIEVTVYLLTHGKEAAFREVYIGGVLAGLGAQLELVIAGKPFYNGPLVEKIRNAGDKSVVVLIRELGGVYEEVLSEGTFVAWYKRGDMTSEYAAAFVKGSVWVTNLYQLLASVNLNPAQVKIKLYDLIQKRMTVLKAMI